MKLFGWLRRRRAPSATDMMSEVKPETETMVRILFEARDRLSPDEMFELTDWLSRLILNRFSTSAVQGALNHPNRKVRTECQRFIEALGRT